MRQDEDGRNLGGKVLRVPRNRDRTTFEAEWRNKVQGRTDPLVRFTSLSLMNEPISDYLTETAASSSSHMQVPYDDLLNRVYLPPWSTWKTTNLGTKVSGRVSLSTNKDTHGRILVAFLYRASEYLSYLL